TMKKLLLLLLLVAVKKNMYAQGVPMFWVDSTNPTIGDIWPSWEPFDIDDNVYQTIYRYSDFAAGMPVQGFITDIFIKLSYPTPAGSKLYGLTVKMDITTMNEFPSNK